MDMNWRDLLVRIDAFQSNHSLPSFQEKAVGVLCGLEVDARDFVFELGATSVSSVDGMDGGICGWDIAASPNSTSSSGADALEVLIFDARLYKNQNHATVIQSLLKLMEERLKPDGVVFAVLCFKNDLLSYDVPNALSLSGTRVLPSYRYLLSDLLANCAVRTIAEFVGDREEGLILARLAIKKPSVLLIFGESHSGKTTLARELFGFDMHMHISSDFVYSTLVREARFGEPSGIPYGLVERLGDGAGQDCFEFNRFIDTSADALDQYADLVISCIPRRKSVVSIDLDLQTLESQKRFKEKLIAAGYSVWVLTR